MQFTGSSCAVHTKFIRSSQEVHAQRRKASNIKAFPGVKRKQVTLRYKALNNNNLNNDDYYYYLKSLRNKEHGNYTPPTVKQLYASCEVHRKGSVQPVEELITVDDAATMLNKSRRMVFEYIKTGKLTKVEKMVNGRKRTMVPLAMCEALCEELGFTQEEEVTSQETSQEETEVAQEEIIASYEVAQEVEVITQEPAQEEIKYLVDVWAEVDRRIANVVQPYREQVDLLTAQNKVLLERLHSIETQVSEVDVFITEWREKQKEKPSIWVKLAFWR